MDIKELEMLVEQQGVKIASLEETLKKIETRQLAGSNTRVAKTDEFGALKLLLDSPSWPAAVDPALICNENSEQDKEDRAEGILDIIIDVHLEKLSFLDFGCGEGHVVNRSLIQNPRMAVGYDIVDFERWKSFPANPALAFTSNWEEVVKNGPYNLVLLYDVIDHMMGEEAIVENLKKIRSVMAPNAKIFVRVHPWCSRHATHLYHKINKAYIHLVFSQEELKEMGYEGQPTRHIIHPVMHYNDCFKSAGLRVLGKEQITNTTIEPFFRDTAVVASRIKENWRKSHEPELREGRKFPWQLEMQFINFVLGSK